MSHKQPTPRARVEPLAERIASELSPFCTRLEIAGSLRRGATTVGDIDLVALPLPGQCEALLDRLTAATTVIERGQVQCTVRLRNGLCVGLYLAHDGYTTDLFGGAEPGNWGSLLLCRTGSRAHNIQLATRAAQHGMQWSPYRGLIRRRQVVASLTEEDIYAALHLPWIKPANREHGIPSAA